MDKEKVYYVKNGDSFVFRMQFSEALKTAPTVEVGGMKVPMTLNEKFLNNEGKYIYEGTVNITEEAKLSQGRLEIVLSNVVDMAGNESTDEVVLNQTPTSNGRVAIYDVTSPGPTILGITGFFNETEDAHYIAYGQKVRVLTYYKEKLSVNPIVKIGNKEFETYYTEDSSDFENGVYAYYADIAITEDLGLNEGEIPFTVYGHKDLAGNEGRAYTNADITYNENDKYENRFDKVIIDKTDPTATITYNTVDPTNHSVVATLTASEEVKILNDGTWNPEDGYGLEFKKSYPENNIQTVTIEDKAGNQNTVEVVINNIDKEAPELVIDTIVDGVSNTENPQIHATDTNEFNISVKLNGKEVRNDKASLNENGIYSSWFGIGHMKDGSYEVTATDSLGNSTTISFELNRSE